VVNVGRIISVIENAGFHAVVLLNDGREIFTIRALTPGVVGVSSILNVRSDRRESDAVTLDLVASRVSGKSANKGRVKHLGEASSRVERHSRALTASTGEHLLGIIDLGH